MTTPGMKAAAREICEDGGRSPARMERTMEAHIGPETAALVNAARAFASDAAGMSDAIDSLESFFELRAALAPFEKGGE